MAKKVQITQEELDKFEMFLFEMDDVLDEFVVEAEQAGYILDYSLDSLDTLERYYTLRHGQMDEERLINRCARYLGEVFRLTVGGKWRLSSHPRGLYFKLPILTDYSGKNLEYCPIAIFRSFVRRPEAGPIRQTVEGHQAWARKPNP